MRLKIFLFSLFLFSCGSFADMAKVSAIDASTFKNVLGCLEKVATNVHSVEKIDNRIYVDGDLGVEGRGLYEYKGKCNFKLLKKFDYDLGAKRGLIYAEKKQDSLSIYKLNQKLWSCPLERRTRLVILNENQVMIERDDDLWWLDNRCNWTLLEKNANLRQTFWNRFSANSNMLSYTFDKKKMPDPDGSEVYLLRKDSLGKTFGTSLSFYPGVFSQNITCGYYNFVDYDDTSRNKRLVKCARWTGSLFKEFELDYAVEKPSGDSHECCGPREYLFVCGTGICAWRLDTKKITVLVEQ